MRHTREEGATFWTEFQNALETDDEPIDKKGVRLLNKFEELGSEEKDIINDVFISLCGYSVTTLKS